jgi:hypothetical protein
MKFVSAFVAVLLIVFVTTPGGVVADDSYGSSSNSEYYNQFSVCADSKVEVIDMSLYCDSPGSYYYGSNKYRNSASCQAGDKAKVQVTFAIQEEIDTTITTDPYLTMEVQGYGTIESITVLQTVSFCESVTSLDGSVCPAVGKYYIKKQFYWGNQNDNYDYSFVPKIMIGVASTETINYYDLGGANTNKCYSGNTFSNWTIGVRKSAATTFESFIISFGILLVSILFIIVFTYCIIKETSRRKYYKESDTMINKTKKDNIVVDEINDYHRLANLMGKESGLVV